MLIQEKQYHCKENTIEKTTKLGTVKVKPLKNNLLIVKCPQLVENEWDYELNNHDGINANMITYGSHVKAWWHCSVCCGRYKMMVKDKANGGGCPYCAGKRVLKGYNDLASQHPDLLNEWDYVNNDEQGLKPDGITSHSSVKIWWRCSQYDSHSWLAPVYSRTRTGDSKSGCPKCAHRISKQEDEVAGFIRGYLCSHYANMKYTMHRSIKIKKIYELLCIHAEHVLSEDLQQHLLKEIDIYIPELGFAVEYDGYYWHSDAAMIGRCGLTNDEVHRIKRALCTQADIKLVFITEHDWVHDKQNQQDMLSSMIETFM